MSSRYERKVGPADVGQSIGLALQTFAQKLQMAEERARLQRENMFLTDFTRSILGAETKEDVLTSTSDMLQNMPKYNVKDPTRAIELALRAAAARPSKSDIEREKRVSVSEELSLKQGQEVERKTQAEEKITAFLSTIPITDLIDPKKRGDILDRARSAALPSEGLTPDIETEVASLVPGVIERFEKANAKDIEEMRESSKRAKLAQVTAKIISAEDFRTDPSKYAPEFIEAGGDVTGLIKLASAKDDQEYADLQRKHINKQIDSIQEDILAKKERREENKAVYTPELLGRLDLALDEKHFNNLTQKSEPLYSEEEKIAQRKKLKGIADAMGYKWIDITEGGGEGDAERWFKSLSPADQAKVNQGLSQDMTLQAIYEWNLAHNPSPK